MQDQAIPQSLTEKIIRNTLSSLGRFALLAVLAFFVTPYILHQLGTAQFGVWALTGVFTTVIRVADFGVSRALVKFIAERNTKDQFSSMNELFNTALCLLLGLGLVMALLCLLLQGWLIERVFRLPEALWPEARFVFATIVIVATLELILGVFQALLDGLQRMDVNNGLAMLNQSLSTLGAAIVLMAGYGLRGLAVKNAVIATLMAILYFVITRRLKGDLVVQPRLFHADSARELITFGLNFQIVNLVVLAIEPLNKTLLTRYVSLDFVAYYEIAQRLLSPLISLFQALAQALYPAASELEAGYSRKAIALLHQRSVRYIAFMAWPVYGLVIVLARSLIASWIGPGYDASAIALQVLAAAWLVSALATPAALIIQGIGMPHLSMLTSVLTGIVSAVGSLALVSTFGFYGLIGANAVGVAGGAMLMFKLYGRVMAVPRSTVTNGILTRALGWSIVLSVGAAIVLQYYQPTSLSLMILIGVVYLALYSIGTWRLGFFDSDDRRLMVHLLRLSPLRGQGI